MQWQYIPVCFHTFILGIKRLSLMPSMDIKLKITRFDLFQRLLFLMLDQMCHGVGLRPFRSCWISSWSCRFCDDRWTASWMASKSRFLYLLSDIHLCSSRTSRNALNTYKHQHKKNIQTTRWQYNDILKEMQLLYITTAIFFIRGSQLWPSRSTFL